MCKMKKLKDNMYVAEIKYDYIVNVINQAVKCNEIDRIILFGSSLTSDCRESSDIDIAVFGKRPKSHYLKSKEFKDFHRNVFVYRNESGQDYDILYFDSTKEYSDDIMNEIKGGLTIYRR